jgi:hypothetical protein
MEKTKDYKGCFQKHCGCFGMKIKTHVISGRETKKCCVSIPEDNYQNIFFMKFPSFY